MIAPLLLLCSALLHQVPGVPTTFEEAEASEEVEPVTVVGEEEPLPIPPPPPSPGLRPEVETGKGALPQMHHGQLVQCGYLKASKAVPSGQYRIQCDEPLKVCLASPRFVLLEDGIEGPEPLAQATDCAGYYGEDWGQKARQGYRFFAAMADAPPGWVRDERGRVMQVSFDLNRRVYLGGAYAPTLSAGTPAVSGRIRADFGAEIEFPGEEANQINRVHLLESELFMGVNTSIEATLVRYDWSVSRQAPLFWLTTFFGTPSRHDFSMDAGGWFEALHLESIRRGAGTTNNFLTLGSAHLTLDLWHSRDLVSYLRLRGGPSAEVDALRGFTAFKPQAALEGDFTLDADGFHHLRLGVAAEKLFFDSPVAERVLNPARLKLRAGYEILLIAVNDYPLTLVVDGRGSWRDDLPGVRAGWEWSGEVGLRFSFWAPARRGAMAQKAQ